MGIIALNIKVKTLWNHHPSFWMLFDVSFNLKFNLCRKCRRWEKEDIIPARSVRCFIEQNRFYCCALLYLRNIVDSPEGAMGSDSVKITRKDKPKNAHFYWRKMSSGDLFVIVCLTLQSLVTCQEVDCSLDSPEVWLKDIAGELHNFRENITEITELQLEKGAAVSTTAGSGESLESNIAVSLSLSLNFT